VYKNKCISFWSTRLNDQSQLVIVLKKVRQCLAHGLSFKFASAKFERQQKAPNPLGLGAYLLN